MAILIDWNQCAISGLMSSIGSNHNRELSEDLIRHILLTNLRNYKIKFENEFGEIIICADDNNYWRRDVFPYYKANRKKSRDASKFDWNLIFNCLNKIRDEIRDNFPYRVIRVPRAEADDVIAVLAKELKKTEKVLVVSNDKDYCQLLDNNVKIYRPTTKDILEFVED